MEINSLRDVQKIMLFLSDSIDDYYNVCDELYEAKQKLAKYEKDRDEYISNQQKTFSTILTDISKKEEGKNENI